MSAAQAINQGVLGGGNLTAPVYGFGTAAGSGGGTTVTNVFGLTVGDEQVVIFGAADRFGTAEGQSVSTTLQRVRTVDVANWQFDPGMGPFFSTVLPDGTIAMPQIQLALSQVASTGKTMSCGFYHPAVGFYSVTVPTSTGATETLAVNTATGVVSDVGGADLSDSAVIWDAGTPVLYCLSALPYRGWRVSVNGVYPVLPAFTLSPTTGRWAHNPSRSISAATLRASDPVNGANAWPNTVNFYGETITDSLLPCELAVLPRSNCLAISMYAPRAGRLWGSVAVVNPVTKVQRGWYEWPNLVLLNTLWGSRGYTRDITTDPTSTAGDERIAVNFDLFVQPNETFNVVVNASSGTFRISWAGVFTSTIPFGATAEQVRAALAAIPAIGANNVDVRLARPFLFTSYTVYEVELVGARAHTDYTTTTIALDAAGLTGNSGSHITRWLHGSTAYTLQGPSPLVELSYNNTSGTLTPLTVPMLPQDGDDHLSRPQKVDSTFGMAWYTQDGALATIVGAVSDNPEILTSLSFRGLHVYRKVGPARTYMAGAALFTGWESTLGWNRPAPDVMTDPVHANANALGLALGEHPDSGAVYAAAASGVLKLALPEPGWAPRSGSLTGATVFTSAADFGYWTVVAPDTLTYDAVDQAARYTSGGAQAEGRTTTPTGLAGIPVPAWMVGQVVNVRVSVKGNTAGPRQVRPGLRFYDANGIEIAALTGAGTAAMYDASTGYRTVMGAGRIPAGCAYLAAEVVVLAVSSGDSHWYRVLDVHVAGFTAIPDVNLGVSAVYSGQAGSPWLAKGYVDPATGHLWLPYLQALSEATAKNARFPAWLVRADLTSILAPYTAEATT